MSEDPFKNLINTLPDTGAWETDLIGDGEPEMKGVLSWARDSDERDVKKISHQIPISPELLADSIIRPPTPEERAEHERREAERNTRMDAARDRLAAITEEPARTILDLHREDERGECAGDDFGGYDGERPDWPCITVTTIAKHYGIEIPE